MSNTFSTFSIYQQLGHIGSEIGRAIGRQKAEDYSNSKKALIRALELTDQMIEQYSKTKNIKELLRLRDAIANIYSDSDDFPMTLQEIEQYTNQFAKAHHMQQN